MMTEADAKARWCPLSRTILTGNSASDVSPACNRIENARTGQIEDVAKCIGSACMAWRWAPHGIDEHERGDKPTGWCGAFGRPEHEN